MKNISVYRQKRWDKLSFIEQMANIGAEFSRTYSWRNRDKKNSKESFIRLLELINLTRVDTKNNKRLKEISRTKEVVCDWYMGGQEYQTTAEQLQKYFLQFAVASRLHK